MISVIQARAAAEKMLSAERFYHTECVAEAAERLAERFGEDPDRAKTAGYLHDIAKEFPKDDLLQMIRRSDIIDVDEIERCPPVWHAYGGGVYVKEMFAADGGIAGAVSCHTTGREGMTRLEKIVFLADYISEDRDFKDMDGIRALAFESLEEAIAEVIERQAKHLMKERKHIDLNMIRAYNDIIAQRDDTGEI